jgi:alcohol dehydrogenase (NADP+)
VICRIAEQHGVSAASILIAWAVNRNTIVIPKSASLSHLQENLQASELKLSDDEMREIARLDREFRFVDGKFWEMAGSPYTAANIWDE